MGTAIGGGFSIETFHLASMRTFATISLTDTYGYWVYCATDITVDAMVTEIQQLGGGAAADLTMGIYAVGSNTLLGSTGNVVPVLGTNVFSLTSPIALTRGTQYYFALYCARNACNFVRRSPSTMQNAGTWGAPAKTNGWVHVSTRFAATATITNIDVNPIWIAARAQTGAAVPLGMASVSVSSTPYPVVAPPSGQELLVDVDTATIAGASTINLPASPNPNCVVNIKDTGNTAASNPITISGNGNLIDGSASIILNLNRGAYRLFWNNVQWRVV